MVEYKLTYFDIRGRAEIARLVFAAADVSYIDDRIKREEWPALKPKTPQGQLPLLTIDGKVTLPQSLAIARFLAKEFGICGKNNLENAKCDVILQTTEDLRAEWVKVFREQDESKKADLQKKLIEETVPKYWTIFENTLSSNSTGYMVGDGLTLGDLAVYDVMEIHTRDYPDLIKGFPKLQAHRQRIAESPNIRKYLEKRPITLY
ncbi:glutathione S-transferase 1-like [Saccostrea echinata]|uniref:glutathione S-transferase 1-like n=1 Tax=Saccostrea echinata TaxID=191078 RepID=UPI002A7FBA01|nr:glutathione S-transferase 1-like [Saccostrea echinata]